MQKNSVMQNVVKNTFILALLVVIITALPVNASNSTHINKQYLIKMSLQEAQIIQQLLQQVEVGTQEVDSFLEIYTPLEQITDMAQAPAEEVTLKLPKKGPQNLLLFMQRATIPGGGAKQVEAIIKKVKKHLPKDSPFKKSPKAEAKSAVLQLTRQEAQLVQQIMDQIELAIPEIDPFLAIYMPIEQMLDTSQEADPTKETTLRLPIKAPQNLLLFMRRASIPGSQAKQIHKIIDKLQHAIIQHQHTTKQQQNE